jgi:hypothetical protein
MASDRPAYPTDRPARRACPRPPARGAAARLPCRGAACRQYGDRRMAWPPQTRHRRDLLAISDPMSKVNLSHESTGAAPPVMISLYVRDREWEAAHTIWLWADQITVHALQIRRRNCQQGKPRACADAGACGNPLALGRAHRLPGRDGTRWPRAMPLNGWRLRMVSCAGCRTRASGPWSRRSDERCRPDQRFPR